MESTGTSNIGSHCPTHFRDTPKHKDAIYEFMEVVSCVYHGRKSEEIVETVG